MALNLELKNIFNFISTIIPFLIIFTITMISIFNQDLKGLIYLTGVFILCFFCVIVLNLVKNPVQEGRSVSCDLFNYPYNINMYDSPSFNSALIAFTFIYFLLPMAYNNRINLPLIIFFLSLFVIDGSSKIANKCTSYGGIVLGGSLGIFIGLIFYNLIHVSGYDSLLFFDEFISNKVQCSRPTKQNFKCSVYKNGEIIRDL